MASCTVQGSDITVVLYYPSF